MGSNFRTVNKFRKKKRKSRVRGPGRRLNLTIADDHHKIKVICLKNNITFLLSDYDINCTGPVDLMISITC